MRISTRGLWPFLFVGCLLAVAPFPGASGQENGLIRVVWQHQALSLVSLAVSGDGGRAATVDRAGSATLLSGGGRPLASFRAGASDRVAMSGDGLTTVAYAAGQPLSPWVYVLGKDGLLESRLEATGPVLNVLVSRRGLDIVALTSDCACWFRRDATRWVRHDLKTGSQLRQIAFGPSNSLYISTRDAEGLYRIALTGRVVWQARGQKARDATLSASADGGLVATVSPTDGRTDVVTLQVRGSDGLLLWEKSEFPARSPRVRVTPEGNMVFVAYERREEHGSAARYERRLDCLLVDPRGKVAWRKGGVYTTPLLAAGASDGRFVVALDDDPRTSAGNLQLINAHGQRQWVYGHPEPIRIIVSSVDGKRLAVYRRDGTLQMLEVTLP